MYFKTEVYGLIFEPKNPLNESLYYFLKQHRAALDGSRMYSDLVDIYLEQERVYKEEMNNVRTSSAISAS